MLYVHFANIHIKQITKFLSSLVRKETYLSYLYINIR